ncbi:hypothetical protein B0H13DRAFT_2303714 [Mycena leptocephala]|nr:hypothetical protein B0H13DRAFT_2303714 [Mycena leptocephala]
MARVHWPQSPVAARLVHRKPPLADSPQTSQFAGRRLVTAVTALMWARAQLWGRSKSLRPSVTQKTLLLRPQRRCRLAAKYAFALVYAWTHRTLPQIDFLAGSPGRLLALGSGPRAQPRVSSAASTSAPPSGAAHTLGLRSMAKRPSLASASCAWAVTSRTHSRRPPWHATSRRGTPSRKLPHAQTYTCIQQPVAQSHIQKHFPHARACAPSSRLLVQAYAPVQRRQEEDYTGPHDLALLFMFNTTGSPTGSLLSTVEVYSTAVNSAMCSLPGIPGWFGPSLAALTADEKTFSDFDDGHHPSIGSFPSHASNNDTMNYIFIDCPNPACPERIPSRLKCRGYHTPEHKGLDYQVCTPCGYFKWLDPAAAMEADIRARRQLAGAPANGAPPFLPPDDPQDPWARSPPTPALEWLDPMLTMPVPSKTPFPMPPPSQLRSLPTLSSQKSPASQLTSKPLCVSGTCGRRALSKECTHAIPLRKPARPVATPPPSRVRRRCSQRACLLLHRLSTPPAAPITPYDPDSLWAEGRVFVQSGFGEWTNGVHVRDMAHAFSFIKKKGHGTLPERFLVAAWELCSLDERDTEAALPRTPETLWTTWRAKSSGWGKAKAKGKVKNEKDTDTD